MRKQYYKYILFAFISFFMIVACNKTENDLLEARLYFEKEIEIIEVGNETELSYSIKSRLTKKVTKETELSFGIGEKDLVDNLNDKLRTDYLAFDINNAGLDQDKVLIKKGEIYSQKVNVVFDKLNEVEEGKTYVVPIVMYNASRPIVAKSNILYLILKKPIKIVKATSFHYSSYLSIPMPAEAKFSSVTYELLINVKKFTEYHPYISTIMGREGVLMFRFGDANLKPNQLQIAGRIEFYNQELLSKDRWYHLAFTYEESTKKGIIYINGKKASEKETDVESFDLSKDMFVGKLHGFMWGERPIDAYMSEVRIWNVARKQEELEQNFLNVDPTSPGLYAYYKLNGSDIVPKSGKNYVKDQSQNGLDALLGNGYIPAPIVDLSEPIKIK